MREETWVVLNLPIPLSSALPAWPIWTGSHGCGVFPIHPLNSSLETWNISCFRLLELLEWDLPVCLHPKATPPNFTQNTHTPADPACAM